MLVLHLVQQSSQNLALTPQTTCGGEQARSKCWRVPRNWRQKTGSLGRGHDNPFLPRPNRPGLTDYQFLNSLLLQKLSPSGLNPLSISCQKENSISLSLLAVKFLPFSSAHHHSIITATHPGGASSVLLSPLPLIRGLYLSVMADHLRLLHTGDPLRTSRPPS